MAKLSTGQAPGEGMTPELLIMVKNIKMCHAGGRNTVPTNISFPINLLKVCLFLIYLL